VAGIGTQVQEKAVRGYRPEAKVELHWVEQTREYADGTPYRLRSPVVKLLTLEGSPIDPVLISLRIPQPVFGAGLLEAVPASRILAAADPDDADGDGISGRPNLVWDQEQQLSLIHI
jgi:CxxC motif-containing protein (DUF1111 family)